MAAVPAGTGGGTPGTNVKTGKPAGGGFPPESQQISGGYYYTNLVNIARWLMAQGYSRAAAAGIAGTVAGESAGGPEVTGSGGAGLIGWTPPSSAFPVQNIVTGNYQQDFDNQLKDLLAYADANSSEAIARGGVDLNTLKKAQDPQQAAIWWSRFEGPLVPGSDVRSGVVTSIYGALAGYQPNQGWAQPGGGPGPSGTGNPQAELTSWNPLSWAEAPIKGLENTGKWITGTVGGEVKTVETLGSGLTDIVNTLTGLVRVMNRAVQLFAYIFQPQFWLRIGAGFVGLLALAGAGYFFVKSLGAPEGE